MKLELDVMERVTSEQQLEGIFQQEMAVLFKHSTRCPISAHAFSEVRSFSEANPELPLFVVHVVEDRGFSDYVTNRTGIRHESPQLFLLTNGTVSWYASHFDIASSSLQERIVG